jgi:beta-phosphoglucomutase-like phosphatase (HAD superfamily)
MIQALIFDFNGVLVDDESVHFELFREVLEQEGVVITERDYHERYLGYDDRGCFAAALGDAKQAYDEQRLADLIARKAQRYVEVAEKGLRYFPFAAETLANLARHWPIAICSGALRSEIEYALKRLDRQDHVAAIIAAEDAHKCKPDPAGYLQALDALRGYLKSRCRSTADAISAVAPDLQARDCLVIEDSLAGILSAKGAGMHAVGISHTYNAVQLRQSGADAVIDGLETLTPEWIKQRF